MAKKQQPWTQVNGRWEQDLGFMPNLYASVAPGEGQPRHWMVACTVRFQYHNPSEQQSPSELEHLIRQAWLETRRQSPGLAVRFDQSSTEPSNKVKVYDGEDDDTVAKWLSSSFRVHRGKGVEPESVLRTLRNDMPYITLNVFPATNHLMITATHGHMDGRGVLYLFDALFRALGSPGESTAAETPASLPPTETELLGLSEVPTEEDKKGAMDNFVRLQQEKPIKMPVKNMDDPPAGFRRAELKLSARTSDTVIQHCREKGYTVTAAWHAAMACAIARTQQLAGEVPGTNFPAFLNCDLRRNIAAANKFFDPRSQPATCYHGMASILVPHLPDNNKSFDDTARDIRSQYRANFEPGTADLGCMPVMAEFSIPAHANGPPPSSTPLLSSVGVLDEYLGHKFGKQEGGQDRQWEVEDVWIAITMLSAEMVGWLWSWDGRIVLSVSWNEAYYKEEEMDGFLGVLKEELLKGLSIDG